MMAGCMLQKQTGFNRDMQNLTAHFNILFNAKEILQQKQEAYAGSFADNYNEILSVYPDTTAQSQTPDKGPRAAIAKAYNIINYKDQSKYIGDAYHVLGQAKLPGGKFLQCRRIFELCNTQLSCTKRPGTRRPDLENKSINLFEPITQGKIGY